MVTHPYYNRKKPVRFLYNHFQILHILAKIWQRNQSFIGGENLRNTEDFLEELSSEEIELIKRLSEIGGYEYEPNPLEKQSLQRELNNLYRKRKRGY